MATRYSRNVTREDPVELIIDVQPVTAYEGETIAGVLLLQGKKVCYRTRGGRPRMMFCNMGTCFECRVRVRQSCGSRWVLACITPVRSQMEIDTDVNLSLWIAGGAGDV